MKRSPVRRTGFSLAVVLAAAAVVAAGTTAAHGTTNPDTNKQLAKVRRATARFHDVDKAEAAGYVSTGECVSSPQGTMGIHYVNPSLIDGTLDIAEPEILLYVPKHNGLRLVAVEYMVPDADQDLATDDDRPALFGAGFDGPMPGHGPGMPVHYDLHAWVWQPNPAGTFEEWNPKISCP